MRCFKHNSKVAMAKAGDEFEVPWSFDHAPCHQRWHNGKDESLPSAAWCTRMPLPMHCADFQQIIEHTVGRWKNNMHVLVVQWCAANPGVEMPRVVVKSLVKEAVMKACEKSAVAKDVARYRTFLDFVRHDAGELFTASNGCVYQGVGGGWPPSAWR